MDLKSLCLQPIQLKYRDEREGEKEFNGLLGLL